MPRRGSKILADEGLAEERSVVGSAVARFLVTGLLVLVLVATPVVLWIRGVAEDHALNNAIGMTQRLADYAIGPLVTEELLAADPAAIAAMNERLEPWVDDEAIHRIKVWTADGRIVYSDQEALIGRKFALETWAETLLAGGPATANLESQHEVENEFEAGEGELVEVYASAVSATGDPLIFEAYFDDRIVRQEQQTVLASIAPAFLLALLLLQLAQLLPAIRLARRVQAHQADRRRLLQHAVHAGELERARLARDLHDGVLQELAGLSYALEANDRHGGAERGGGGIGTLSHSIVQGSIQTLRDVTGSLYSPALDAPGLPEAMARLTDPVAARGIAVRLDLREVDGLTSEQATMLYRVAREALANVVKHARAGSVDVALARSGSRVSMTVRDDGRGFDAQGPPPGGHLGLRIMRDLAAAAGGSFEVGSTPGGGTSIVVTVREET